MVQHWSTCKFYNTRYALLIGSGSEGIYFFFFIWGSMSCGYEKHAGKQISPLSYHVSHKT